MCDVFVPQYQIFKSEKNALWDFFFVFRFYSRGLIFRIVGVRGDYVRTLDDEKIPFLHSHCGSRWGEGSVRLHYRQRENWSTFSITIDFSWKDFRSKKEFSTVICDVTFWNEGWPVKGCSGPFQKTFFDLIFYVSNIHLMAWKTAPIKTPPHIFCDMFKTFREQESVARRSWYGPERRRNEACNKGCLKSDVLRDIPWKKQLLRQENYFAFIFLSFSFVFLFSFCKRKIVFLLCSWYHPWQNFPFASCTNSLVLLGFLPLSMLNVGSVCKRSFCLMDARSSSLLCCDDIGKRIFTSTLASWEIFINRNCLWRNVFYLPLD